MNGEWRIGMVVIAMIPGRMGSERLPLKNMALLNGRPLISYAIGAAIESAVFDRVILNSDGPIFEEIANQLSCEFYLRPSRLGSSETKSDEVIYDFMENHASDIVAWINPTSPLQTGDEIREVITYFIEHQLDSLITVENKQVHCVYGGDPLNFTVDGLFAKTQDLTPVQPFVYSVMMWRTKSFMDAYKKQGHALLSGKLGYFPVSKESAVIIKTDVDLMIAESVLKAKADESGYQVIYDDLVSNSRV